MRKIVTIFVAIMAITIFTGCDTPPNTDDRQAEKTEMIQDRLNSRLGLPNIQNGQEKRLIKELYELRDQVDLATFCYTYNEMTGEHRFLGKSIGFGIPASVQYSNPEKAVQDYPQEFGTLPQAEPNGLFMPTGLSATWVFLLNPVTSEPSPTYVEPTITVSLFPLPNAVYPQDGPQYRDLVQIK